MTCAMPASSSCVDVTGTSAHSCLLDAATGVVCALEPEPAAWVPAPAAVSGPAAPPAPEPPLLDCCCGSCCEETASGPGLLLPPSVPAEPAAAESDAGGGEADTATAARAAGGLRLLLAAASGSPNWSSLVPCFCVLGKPAPKHSRESSSSRRGAASVGRAIA